MRLIALGRWVWGKRTGLNGVGQRRLVGWGCLNSCENVILGGTWGLASHV